MDRSYVVLGVSASIDGRITLGPDRTMFDMDERDSCLGTEDEWNDFMDILENIHQPDVWMEGSNMLVKESEDLKELEPYTGDISELYQDHLPDHVVNDPKRKGWLAVVDGRGRLRSGFKGEENKPMLHLVSYGVSPEYLSFLRKKGIPYLISGEDRVDLEDVLRKMKSTLNIDTILTSSGGRLAGALIRNNILDEVNIRFNPVVIGGFETPSLFNAPELKKDQWPIKLLHISTQVKASGHLIVRYKVDNS